VYVYLCECMINIHTRESDGVSLMEFQPLRRTGLSEEQVLFVLFLLLFVSRSRSGQSHVYVVARVIPKYVVCVCI